MLIMVSGPYSAPDESKRRENLRVMNQAAVEVMKRGHIPVIGVNAALPVAELMDEALRYEAIMTISLALAERCEAVLMTGRSPGADRELEVFEQRGLPVFFSIDEVASIKGDD